MLSHELFNSIIFSIIIFLCVFVYIAKLQFTCNEKVRRNKIEKLSRTIKKNSELLISTLMSRVNGGGIQR